MICPNCEFAYDDEILVCPECGADHSGCEAEYDDDGELIQ